jgi:uncharacterized damage-inducible protein DinB
MIKRMNRQTVELLWQFTEYSWAAYEESIRPHGDRLLTSPAPGSGWPTLRDALVHICWAYVRWLSDPVSTTERPAPVPRTWEELDRYRAEVRDHARRYLDALEDRELTTVRPMRVDSVKRRYSPAEVFATVLLHERQHHGDLNTLLYQLDREIPVVEYRFSLPGREG